MDILCREGCRLKRTRSPSCRDCSSVHPTLIFGLLTLVSMRAPLGSTAYRILPSSRAFLRAAMLWSVTLTGLVSVLAMLWGMPISESLSRLSPVMTHLPDWSTLLPMQCPLMVPSLPLILPASEVYSLRLDLLEEPTLSLLM